MTKRFKVSYTIKDMDNTSINFGYIIDRDKKFDNFKSAVNFIRQLKTETLIGKPVLEKVG
jgi:hypothetical protein